MVVVVAGQQQPVEQLKENREELPLSSPHERRRRWLFAFPLQLACDQLARVVHSTYLDFFLPGAVVAFCLCVP